MSEGIDTVFSFDYLSTIRVKLGINIIIAHNTGSLMALVC